MNQSINNQSYLPKYTKNEMELFFITIICFTIALILFFELVLAHYIEVLAIRKSNIIVDYANDNIYLKKGAYDIIEKFDKKYNSENIKEQTKKRQEENFKSLYTGVLWMPVVLTIIFIVYSRFSKNKNISHLTKFEKYILIFLAVSAFVVEILFYIILVKDWKFITDHEIYSILMFGNKK